MPGRRRVSDAQSSSPELDALVAKLNARLRARLELSDLRAFDAHPNSPFHQCSVNVTSCSRGMPTYLSISGVKHS